MQNSLTWSPDQPLHLLAIDTSTSTLSLGVARWAAHSTTPHLFLHQGAGAAQSSGSMIPAIQDLLTQAELSLSDLHAIVFGAGPGSFTGLRTACAVAQGLALSANLPVLPVNTLMAVAQDWHTHHQALKEDGVVWSLIDARMQEMYAGSWRLQHFQGWPSWHEAHPACLVAPNHLEALPELHQASCRAGNVTAEYGDVLPWSVDPAMPTAAAMLQLAPALLLQGQAIDPALALPYYVRNKVAQTTAERAAAAAARA